MDKRTIKRSHIVLTALYAFCICFLAAAPLWPQPLWWLANLFQILPLWVFFLPAIFLLGLSLFLKDKNSIIVNAVAMFLVLFGIMGFNLPVNFRLTSSELKLRVMTVNAGGKTDFDVLSQYAVQMQPDVILFQETDGRTQGIIAEKLSGLGWEFAFRENLGVGSKFKINEVDFKNREIFKDWGAIVARFSLQTPSGVVRFLSIHLETPREGIEALMDKKLEGIKEMVRVTERQRAESQLASQFIGESFLTVIGGDFNMLQNNPIFQKYWGKYMDVFARQGLGFGYTKFTRWHGVRIDHILTDNHFGVSRVFVGPNLGSDHRPVVADLNFLWKLGEDPAVNVK